MPTSSQFTRPGATKEDLTSSYNCCLFNRYPTTDRTNPLLPSRPHARYAEQKNQDSAQKQREGRQPFLCYRDSDPEPLSLSFYSCKGYVTPDTHGLRPGKRADRSPGCMRMSTFRVAVLAEKTRKAGRGIRRSAEPLGSERVN
ncbi:UNVERIFIED_CONTAM: hypothetical protein K2H54_019860 [Gekko kuhli]